MVSRFTVILLAWVAFVLGLNLALRAGGWLTTLTYTRAFVEMRGADDSWRPMLKALAAAGENDGSGLYEGVFFAERVKFQYPPTALFLPLGVSRVLGLDLSTSLARNRLTDALNLLGWWATALLIAVVLLIFVDVVPRQRLACGGSGVRAADAAARFGGLLFLAVSCHPVVLAFALGQIQTFVNLLFGLTLWLWLRGRKGGAGACVALMSLIKPHYVLLVIWGLTRRHWRFATVALGMITLGALASVAVFGWQSNLQYLDVLAYIGRHGEAFYPNQSPNGLMNRLMTPAEAQGWNPSSYPSFSMPVLTVTVASGLALTAMGLFASPGGRRSGDALDLSMMALATTMASPVAWEHHYGITLPIFVLVAGELARFGAPRAAWMSAAAASYLLLATFVEPLITITEPPANLLQSYTFAGAALLLMILYAVRSRQAAGGRATPDERYLSVSAEAART